MLIDLHVHSDLSPCSRMPLGEILGRGRELGLDGVCITDHGGRLAMGQVVEGAQDDGLVVLVGQEYATTQGDFLLFGDLGYFPPGLDAPSLLALVEGLGGAAVAAHPFRPGRSLDQGLMEQGLIKVAEGVNGRNPKGANLPMAELAQALGVRLVGGSDAHSIQELGRVATWFDRPIASQAELVAALKSGEFRPVRMTSRRVPQISDGPQRAAGLPAFS